MADENMRGESSVGMGETMDEGMHQDGLTLHVSKSDVPGCKPGDKYTFTAGEADQDGDIPFTLTSHEKANEEEGGAKPWEDGFREAMSPRNEEQPQMPDNTY